MDGARASTLRQGSAEHCPVDCPWQEYKIHNCEILFREDCTVDQLIDVIEVRCPLSRRRSPLHCFLTRASAGEPEVRALPLRLQQGGGVEAARRVLQPA